MADVRLVRVDRRKKESNYLADANRRVTSQHGEDGIIEKLFEIIGAGSRWCVEFGAWDGKTHSNTWNLIHENGWRSVQIEANAGRHASLVENHAEHEDVYCLNSLVGFDPEKDNLDIILGTTPIPANFDFLIIDVDGCDWHIWDSMTRYRPRAVMIEFNPAISNDVYFVQDRDFVVNQGSSLYATIELGKKKGYELVCVYEGNAIFVDAADYPKFNIADNSIDAMAFPTREGRLFLGYDGTLVNVGLSRVGLRQPDRQATTIEPFDLQVFASEDRWYSGRVPQAFLEAKKRAQQKAQGETDKPSAD